MDTNIFNSKTYHDPFDRHICDARCPTMGRIHWWTFNRSSPDFRPGFGLPGSGAGPSLRSDRSQFRHAWINGRNGLLCYLRVYSQAFSLVSIRNILHHHIPDSGRRIILPANRSVTYHHIGPLGPAGWYADSGKKGGSGCSNFASCMGPSCPHNFCDLDRGSDHDRGQYAWVKMEWSSLPVSDFHICNGHFFASTGRPNCSSPVYPGCEYGSFLVCGFLSGHSIARRRKQPLACVCAGHPGRLAGQWNNSRNTTMVKTSGVS